MKVKFEYSLGEPTKTTVSVWQIKDGIRIKIISDRRVISVNEVQEVYVPVERVL